MSKILIFSDNNALIKLWSAALSIKYQVNTVDDIYADITADAIIIDAHKIDNDDKLFSFLKNKSTRILVVGTNWSEDNQIKALVHGAAGYCGESEPPALLLQAVECILKGDTWIQRHLVPKVIGTLIQMKSASVEEVIEPKSIESTKLLQTLSDRELDVAKMIRFGDSNKSIASSLNISERTVKAHLTSTFKKLKVTDRLHLALFIKEFD